MMCCLSTEYSLGHPFIYLSFSLVLSFPLLRNTGLGGSATFFLFTAAEIGIPLMHLSSRLGQPKPPETDYTYLPTHLPVPFWA